MYKPIPNGSKVTIQGLDCWVPPIGMGSHCVTEELAVTDIIKRSDNPKEQYWERQELPEDFEEMVAEEEEEATRRNDPEYSNPQLDAIREREWRRRLYGVWFYNNGKPTYLTGLHYFFLNYWELDIGYPAFRIIDLEFFYFWEYCCQDPLCYGALDLRKRRDGKSYRGGCILYEAASRTEKAHCGMMQKKYEDARDEIYMKCVLPQFQQLPSFFRPTYDTAAGDAPVSGLRFFKPSKKGKKAMESYRNKTVRELRSRIDYRETKVKTYDGSKLYRVFADERAKVEIDVVEAHGVLKKCLENDVREVVGKMLVASTVEEIGIKFRYQRLWEMSDQYNREKTGKTKSGLYRFFIPADRSGARDIYGFPLKEQVRAEILAEREALEDNQTDLADAIRKEPLSVEEAFAVANKDCHYNLPKLNWQRSNLSQLERITQRGNFMWENATPFTRVVWEANTNGRWEMPVGFSFSDTSLINNVAQLGSQYRPGNKARFSLGLDPYDHDIVEDENRRSMAAALVLKKYDPMQPDDPFGKAFICKYHGRPKTATLMYDDILKTCWYFGCQVLYESNKPGIKKYFVDNNCEGFLVKIPGYSDYGIPSTQENKRAILDCTEEYIENYVDRVYFLSLIDDWIKFDVTKTQKFDLAMAAGWTLIAELQKVSRGEGKLKPITDFIRKHKIA